MRHLLFLFIHDLILIQGKIKSTRYGLLTELALLVECGSSPELHCMHYMLKRRFVLQNCKG